MGASQSFAFGLLLALVPLVGSCSGPAEPPRDVLLVVLDALRADALSCYGASRPTSPRIDRFAEEAVVVLDVHSAASYTLASVASLFTGLRPAEHRVLGLSSNVLPAELPTLPERLAAAGFATAGFSSNPHITAEGGFARGFAQFHYLPRDRFDAHLVPEAVAEEVLAFWSGAAGARRFAYVHVLPPHQPYDPPPPFSSLFGADRVPREEAFTDRMTALQQSGAAAADRDLVARLRDRYDANVAYADAWFGDLWDQLQRLSAEDTLVVLTSDHGEGFGEHGDILHGANPFAEMTRVPLILKAPGLDRRRLGGVRSQVDLAATICEALDLSWAGGGLGFWGAIAGRGDKRPGEALSRSMGTRPLWALRTDSHTFVAQPRGDFAALFARDTDPLEGRDIRAEEPELAAELGARLERILQSDQSAAAARPRPTRHGGDRRALEALGYTGASGLMGEEEGDGDGG